MQSLILGIVTMSALVALGYDGREGGVKSVAVHLLCIRRHSDFWYVVVNWFYIFVAVDACLSLF